MSVNSKMSAIADKIRSLLGLTGTMGLDAMATNLATANTHVADALAALVEKEVDTTGKGLADLAALIAAIESGGGLLHTSTFCMSEDTVVHGAFYHNAGFAPDFVIVIPAYSTITTYAEGRTQCAIFISNPNLGSSDTQINLAYVVSWKSSSEKIITVNTYLNINAFVPTNEEIRFYLNQNTHKFLAGDVYTFIAAKVWG